MYAYQHNTLPKYVLADQENHAEQMARDYPLAFDPTRVHGGNPEYLMDELVAGGVDIDFRDTVSLLLLYNPGFMNLVETYSNPLIMKEALSLNSIEQAEAITRFAIPENLERFVRDLERQKLKFRAEFEKELQLEAQIEKRPAIPLSEFEVSERHQHLVFEAPMTLMDFFDRIQVSADVPVVVSHEFYKVFVDYPYALEIPDKNSLYLYIQNHKVILTSLFDSTADPPPFHPMFKLSLIERAEVLDFSRNLLKQVVSPHPLKFQVKGYTLSGEFIVKDAVFNPVVMSDLLFTVSSLSSVFIHDEHNRASRDQPNIPLFYFKEPNSPALSLFLRIRYQTILRAKMAQGQTVVRVSQIEEDDIPVLRDHLTRLFKLYALYTKEITKDYQLLLPAPLRPRMNPPDLKVPFSGKTLSDLAPDMFRPTWSRQCGFTPRIVDESEQAELESRGFTVMQFPDANVDEKHEHFFFACDHHAENAHIFPGLHLNKLDNKNVFPVLPCCYKQEQASKKTSLYYRYLRGMPLEFPPPAARRRKEAPPASRHLLTNKFVQEGQTGEIPFELRPLFTTLDQPRVLRRGLNDSASSLLEGVLFYIFPGFSQLSPPQRKRKTLEERLKLARLPLESFLLLKQSFPFTSATNIRAWVRDPSKYLDPRKFKPLLEHYYDCHLVVFNRSGFVLTDSVGGSLRLPRGTSPDTPRGIIVLYENQGMDTDNSPYPRLEQLGPFSEPTLKRLVSLEHESSETWSVRGKRARNMNEYVPKSDDTEVVNGADIHSQFLDTEGRVFAVNIPSQGLVTLMLERVIPPLRVPEATSFYPVAEMAAESVILQIPFSLYQPKTVKRASVDGIQINVHPLKEGESSLLHMFFHQRRQSQVLSQNAIRLGSNAIQVRADASPVPSLSTRNWTKAPLRVPDAQLKQRLDYQLSLSQRRNPTQMDVYSELKYLPLPYQHISDFSIAPLQVIAPIASRIKWAPATQVLGDAYVNVAGTVYHLKELSLSDSNTAMNASSYVRIFVDKTREVLEIQSAGKDPLLDVYYRDSVFFVMQVVEEGRTQ